MKKVLRIVLIAILTIMCYATVANAASGDKLIQYVKNGVEISGKEYKFSDSDVLKLEKYLRNNPITETQENQIITKADEIVSIMRAEGVSDVNKLPKEKKQQVFGIAQEAASVVNINLTYDSSSKRVVLSKDGVKLDAIPLENTKLIQTGTSYVFIVNFTIVAVIAIATIIVKTRKKTVNA